MSFEPTIKEEAGDDDVLSAGWGPMRLCLRLGWLLNRVALSSGVVLAGSYGQSLQATRMLRGPIMQTRWQ